MDTGCPREVWVVFMGLWLGYCWKGDEITSDEGFHMTYVIFREEQQCCLFKKSEHGVHLKLVLELLRKEKLYAKVISVGSKDWEVLRHIDDMNILRIGRAEVMSRARTRRGFLDFEGKIGVTLDKSMYQRVMDKILATPSETSKVENAPQRIAEWTWDQQMERESELVVLYGLNCYIKSETTDKVVLIKEKFKAARDRQKSYADNRRKPLEFEVGDRVMLKVSPWKGVIRFGKIKGKLARSCLVDALCWNILDKISKVFILVFSILTPCVVMICFLVTPRVSALAGCDSKSELIDLKNIKVQNLTIQHEVSRLNIANESLRDEVSDLKKGRRKETQSPKDVMIVKAKESPTKNSLEYNSDNESLKKNHEPLPPLPKLLGAEPTSISRSPIHVTNLTKTSKISDKTKQATEKVKIVIKKTQPKPSSVPEKKLETSTEELLLTLMKEDGRSEHYYGGIHQARGNKARIRGKVFNWKTAKYGKVWYDEDIHDLRSVETEFPAIAFNYGVSSKKTLSCEPTVSSLNDEIDFRISFDDFDDEDYT
ncbi:hypothetical protein Tco_0429054, partial [Tanacetum coccineum]